MKPSLSAQYRDLERWHWWFRGRQRIFETVLRNELAGRRNLRLASVGSGPAEGLAWLVPLAEPAGRVLGVDHDFRQAGKEQRVDFVVGKAESIPLAAGSFDAVLALDVLEHLDDDAGALREAARLVAPGGLVLVTVPALPSLWGLQDEVNEHRRRYTSHTLQQTFELAGLAHPRITHFNALMLPPIAAVRWFRRAWGQPASDVSDFDSNRPGFVNELLAATFAAERHLVGRFPIPAGVSLLATWRA